MEPELGSLIFPPTSLSLPVSVHLSVSVYMPMCGPEVDTKCILLLFALFLVSQGTESSPGSASLSGQQSSKDPSVCLLPGQPPRAGVIGACSTPNFSWVLGIQIQALLFVQQILSHQVLSEACGFVCFLRLRLPCVEGKKYQINGCAGVPG